MALSNGRGFNSGPLIFLSPRSKDVDGNELDKPYFEVSRVNPENNKIERTDERPSEINDVTLSSIQFKEREGRGGGVNKHVVLYLRDPEANETYSLDLTYRIATRSLFNTLINLKSAEKLSISIYRSKKGYESFYLTQAGQKVGWKYEKKEDLPEAEVIKDRKGAVVKTDYSAIDDFFEAELKVLTQELKLGAQKQEAAAPASTTQDDGAGEPEPVKEAPKAAVKAAVKTAAPAKSATTPAAKSTTTAQTAKSAAPKPTGTRPGARPAAKPVAAPAPEAEPAPVAAGQENLDEDVPF